ncbi:aspartate/glutamate racemase family protein [uncultured Ilyobacter sp.]|uniref:maleate cis-trans isomerase family protein n=1 Tax=uncultured Ilyobacter sp. TaxID=544433 RepID=UPI0029F5A744|nr:aspartate/glutamate racemase family protein [uncultured Ilyobacter sp.]
MKDFLYGEIAKVGLIYPCGGWIMEPEFYEMSPMGVSTYTTRVLLDDVNENELSKLGDRTINATKLLCKAPVDIIALGCTSGSFIGGAKYDEELIKKMEKASGGVPCTTTSSAVVAALRNLNVKKVALATPYTNDVNMRAKIYLEEYGFKVTNICGLGLINDSEIDRQKLEVIYKLAKDANTDDAEAVAILCTGIRSIPILEALEKDLGKPVISAVQATFWHCLCMTGIKEKISGYGSLLESI